MDRTRPIQDQDSDSFGDVTTYRGQSFVGNRISGSTLNFQSTQLSAAEQLKDSLHFPEYRQRLENIEDAHNGTYMWIFDIGFKNFLCGTVPHFWITGKPGCGKSTLMAFILRNACSQVYFTPGDDGQAPLVIAHSFGALEANLSTAIQACSERCSCMLWNLTLVSVISCSQ